MTEERYHMTTQNWFYHYMSNINKNITAEAKLNSPPTYFNSAQKMLFGSPTLVHMAKYKNCFITQYHVIELAHFVLF